MTADPTIDGVLLTELRQIIDERGAVLHHFRCDVPEFTKFGESYFSEMVPGAVKAWKRHRQQTQNLTVPIGRVRFASGTIARTLPPAEPSTWSNSVAQTTTGASGSLQASGTASAA